MVIHPLFVRCNLVERVLPNFARGNIARIDSRGMLLGSHRIVQAATDLETSPAARCSSELAGIRQHPQLPPAIAPERVPARAVPRSLPTRTPCTALKRPAPSMPATSMNLFSAASEVIPLWLINSESIPGSLGATIQSRVASQQANVTQTALRCRQFRFSTIPCALSLQYRCDRGLYTALPSNSCLEQSWAAGDSP
jgi:hypothetical protein